ncbi:hypothetical protein PG990_000396, partial [Apiospora arundinis]
IHVHNEFDNWGQAVKNTPKFTLLPTTPRRAKPRPLECIEQSPRALRGLPPQLVADLQSGQRCASIHGQSDPGQVHARSYVPTAWRLHKGPKERLCRIGVAVTNEDFRRWALANKTWALPVDVILVEATIGGVNGPICHGAGLKHQTCSDLVRRIEYVDCHGEL